MKLKILLISDDVAGREMAGPGIRAWEMWRELSRNFSADLMVPEYSSDTGEDQPGIIRYSEKQPDLLVSRAGEYDVLIVQGYILTKFPALCELDKIIVVDLYVPFVLENMFNHMYRLKPEEIDFIYRNDLKVYNRQLLRGNIFLVANRYQYDLVSGGLLLHEKINPGLILQGVDPGQNLLQIPFGFREETVKEDRGDLKEALGFDRNDFLLLWGGVITNWFDPLTLIEAVAKVAEKNPQVKLLFLSTGHANPLLPKFDMAEKAMTKARELGIMDKNVFFNTHWIPYKERWRYFGAADLGVSAHKIHIETRYSFRTRFLDYLNFRLPIISTEGDFLTESLFLKGAVHRVGESSVTEWAEGIKKLSEDRDYYKKMMLAVERERKKYCWEQVLSPLKMRLESLEAGESGVFSVSEDPAGSGAEERPGLKNFIKRWLPLPRRLKNSALFIRLRSYLEK